MVAAILMDRGHHRIHTGLETFKALDSFATILGSLARLERQSFAISSMKGERLNAEIDCLDLPCRSQMIWQVFRVSCSHHQSKQRSIALLCSDYERFHTFLQIMDVFNRTARAAELRIFISLKPKLFTLTGLYGEGALSGYYSGDLTRGSHTAFGPPWSFFLREYGAGEKQCCCQYSYCGYAQLIHLVVPPIS